MLKRVLLVSLIAAPLMSAGLFAQSPEPDAFQPDNTFSGVSGAVWHVDLSSLNDALGVAGYPALPSVVAFYGQTSHLGRVDGLRFGILAGYGLAASRTSTRRAELSFTLGAGLVEWGSGHGPDASIALGLLLGAGSSVLTLINHRPETFDDALNVPFRAELDSWLYTIEPTVSAQGKPAPWLAVKLRVGYLLAFGCSWRIEGVPLDRRPGLLAGPIAEVSLQFISGQLFPSMTPTEDETSAE
jgi:hypothetical protein